MDFDLARHNMIENQLRAWEVLDQATLDLFAAVRREDFVPSAFRAMALADVNIPLGHGEVTMTPKVEARMVQALELSRHDKVLEVGTGCGFVTAILASAAGTVHSVDIHADFTQTARPKLEAYRLDNVRLHTGDAVRGWPAEAPYDVIAVTGSVPTPAHMLPFEQQLRTGGRLFIIVGQPPVMDAILVTRVGESEWARESIFETDLPPLVNAAPPPAFRF
jgi:protein-L-isoaspartate(D-aspartate) O-methyltransferase